jgi:23S rRNA pseudouridine955/2504/2580 synthase
MRRAPLDRSREKRRPRRHEPAAGRPEHLAAPVQAQAGGRARERPRPALRDDADEVTSPEALTQRQGVQNLTVAEDEGGMRVDRFLEAKFPGLSFSHIQRVVRKGELRVDGRRVETKDRLEPGQKVRVPPLSLAAPKREGPASDAQKTREFLRGITLYEDEDVLVLNKPMGLAVQGGSGTLRHVDGMLGALQDRDGQRPRLVHRLDKDTSGCLLVAKSRFAAAALAKTFRSRSARKIYWALVAGVPRVKNGKVSTFLSKEEVSEHDTRMRIAKHGDDGAMHAVTYYAVVETAAQRLAWLSLKPVTGRTHQLRAHAAHIGHPIVGDPKYFDIENWEFPRGLQNKLHLLARRIVVPHPRGKQDIDVSAPLPPHMAQSFNLLGFDASRYDPIVEAPEE